MIRGDTLILEIERIQRPARVGEKYFIASPAKIETEQFGMSDVAVNIVTNVWNQKTFCEEVTRLAKQMLRNHFRRRKQRGYIWMRPDEEI